MDDPYDLARFLEAQGDGVWERALAELKAGRKQTHWMWFVFPQLAGLGSSPMAQRYAIASLDEARAYLGHPVLGSRLRACVDAILGVEGRSARELMGPPDDLKLRSSLTLFARAAAAGPDAAAFRQALTKYFGGAEDERTVERL